MMDDTLAGVVLVLKNLCFNIVSVLTVLVALGNELKRLRLTYAWLEERRAELERAWKISLGVYLALAVAYAGLKHQPAALVIDSLMIAAMVYTVAWLRHRGGALTDADTTPRPRRGADDPDDEETFTPRRPLPTRRDRRQQAPDTPLQPRRRRRPPRDPDADETPSGLR